MTVRLVMDHDTSKCVGYGFLDFDTAASAERALTRNREQKSCIPGHKVLLRLDATVSYEAPVDTYQIYVGNLSPEVTGGDLFKAFKNCCSDVTNARVIYDPVTCSSRQYGFVRCKTSEAAYAAIRSFRRVQLGTFHLVVRKTYSHHLEDTSKSARNLPQISEQQAISSTMVFVAGLADDVVQSHLRAAFAGFGELEDLRHIIPKKCAVITYTDHVAALACLSHMRNFPLNGQKN